MYEKTSRERLVTLDSGTNKSISEAEFAVFYLDLFLAGIPDLKKRKNKQDETPEDIKRK